jgi:hypothetical protein
VADVIGAPRPGTDIYTDAAGAAAVVDTVLASAKWGAKLVMVAVQKKPEPIDLPTIAAQRADHRRVHGLPHGDLQGDAALADGHARRVRGRGARRSDRLGCAAQVS